MSTQIIEQSIRDVLPTLSEQVPSALKKLTVTFYNSSKSKINLNPTEEVARYHLSAFIAAERMQDKLDLPEPSLKNLPIPAKLSRSLLAIFKYKLSSDSNAPTPQATPRKRAHPDPIPVTPSPQKRGRGRPPGSKTKSEFQKRLEAIAATDTTIAASATATPSTSPVKILTKDLEDEADAVHSEAFLHLLTSREITSLCNKFQLDSSVVDNILQTFQKYSTKAANEWTLICGLVLNCYFVVNHKLLSEQIGSKSTVVKSMLSLQNGGLRLGDIQQSIEFVNSLITHNRWFKTLKLKHGFPFYEKAGLEKYGSMITKQYQFCSKSMQTEYEEWVAHTLNYC